MARERNTIDPFKYHQDDPFDYGDEFDMADFDDDEDEDENDEEEDDDDDDDDYLKRSSGMKPGKYTRPTGKRKVKR